MFVCVLADVWHDDASYSCHQVVLFWGASIFLGLARWSIRLAQALSAGSLICWTFLFSQMDSSDGERAVVIDPGSFNLRIGIAGDDAPKATEAHDGELIRDGGIVVDRERFEAELKEHLHRTMHLGSQDMRETSFLFAERFFGARRENREYLASLVLERLEGAGLWFSTGVLGLYAAGRTTGCLVDVGRDTTDVCNVYEGFPLGLPGQNLCTRVGGQQCIASLQEIWAAEHAGASPLGQDVARAMFQQCATLAESPGSCEFVLPDGNRVQVSERTRTESAAVLFGESPYSPPGVADTVSAAVWKTDVEFRTMMVGNLVLCGSPTLGESA